MKVAVISNYHSVEGNAIWEQARSGCDVQIASPKELCHVDTPERCVVEHLETKSLTGLSASFRWDVGLTTWIKDFNPDVIHYNGEAWSMGLRRCIQTGVPTVVHVAETRIRQGSSITSALRKKIAASNLSRISGVAAWSTAALSALEPVGIRPGVPSAVFPAKTKLRRKEPKTPATAMRGALSVIFVGRLVEEKGVRTLLSAIEAFEPGEVQLAIAGEGPLRSFIDSRRKNVSIKLLGHLPALEVESHIRNSDVLVLPSRDQGNVCEQFGLVLVEAMAQGTAILASNVCSIPEVLEGAGLLIAPDDPAALRDAFVLLRRDLSELNRLESQSAAAYLRFSPDVLAAKSVRLWKQVLLNNS